MQHMNHWRNFLSRYSTRLSVACFVASPFLPAYYYGKPLTPVYGASLLVFGWLGPLTGYFAWLANPVYAVALALGTSKRPRACAVASLIGLAFALSFLVHKEVLDMDKGDVLHRTVMAYGFGYGVWLAAFIVLGAGAVIHARDAHSARQQGIETAGSH